MPSFTQWQGRDYPGGDTSPDMNRVAGPQPFFRDDLDQLRSGWRATPEATYPDGYLGTLNSRRGDRLMQNLIDRQRNRPYTRGVHKGERIEARDYYWPEEFTPMTGLELEAMGEKFAPPGMGFEWAGRPLWDDPQIGPRAVPRGRTAVQQTVDPNRREGLMPSRPPPWSTGRPQMSTPYPGAGQM